MAGPWEDYQAQPESGPWSDYAPTGRKTPKQMKIGSEGFGEAFKEVLAETPSMTRKLAAFGSFPRQMYEGAKQILGREDKPAIEAQRQLQAAEPGAAIAGGVASAVPLSMIPGAGSIAGQAIMGGAMGGLTPTEAGESRTKNIALSALTAGGLGTAMKGAGMAAKPFLARAEQSVAAKASQESVRDETIKLAHSIGLRLPGTATGGGEIAEAVESVGMRGATAREFSILNQPKVNAVARQEAGLPPNAPINEETLKAARDRLASPYREVEQLASGHPLTQPPFKPMAETLNELKQARGESNLYWKAYGRLPLPSLLKRAQRMDDKVDLLEKSIDAVASSLGKPDLVQRLAASRVALAKNYNVESAVNLGTGDVESKTIGQLLDRKGLNAVTGGLQIIGRVAQSFPNYVNAGARGTSRAAGYGIARPIAAGALGLGGYEVGEKYGFGPWGASAAGLALLSGPARRIALSRMLQATPKYEPGMAAQLTHAATGPLAQRLIPLSAVAAQQEQR